MTATADTIAGHECRVTIEQREDGAVLAVSGNLSWRTVTGLHEALEAIGAASSLVIDLTDVTAIDSAGTGGLITAYLRHSNPDRHISVVATGFIAAVLEGVGISSVLPTFPSRQRAEEWMAAT